METKGILAEVDAEIALLQQVRAILTGSSNIGRKRTTKTKTVSKKRRLSPEARARIAAAQRARWAKVRKAAK
jgi:hypothetical protein